MKRLLGLVALLASIGCSDDQQIGRLTVQASFQPGRIDFGEVPIGLSRSLTVILVNEGAAPFTIDELVSSSAFSIRPLAGLLEGRTVSGGERVELEISFVSIAEATFSETAVVKSGDVDIDLQLDARGVLRMEPVFAVEPPVLDFGVVQLGTETTLPIAINNNGNSDGTLSGASLTSGATDFVIEVPWPIILAKGIRGVFQVKFRPTRPGSFTETLVIASQEGPTVEVSVVGTALGGDGQFFCNPSAVVFGTVERGQTASRSITCTAQGGAITLQSAELAMNTQYYAIRSQPPPSGVAENGQVSYEVEFLPDGPAVPHNAALWIHYDGAQGRQTLAIPLSGDVGVPPPAANAITVDLTWDTDFTDVDIHLVRPGGSPFSLDDDCFWAASSPDWGAVGSEIDNPNLDVDDIDGFGPENINLRTAPAGQYVVYAHYYADRNLGPTNITMNVFVGGVQSGTVNYSGLVCNDLFMAGTISWNGSSGTFAPASSVTATQNGNCN